MTSTNTYAYGSFPDDRTELQRLERQAGIDPTLELGMLRAFGLAPGQHVLDLGCGPGIITSALARVVTEGGAAGSVVGADVNKALLERAVENNADRSEVEFRLHDMAVAPLTRGPDATFDFTYARFVYQHLSDPSAVARNTSASLRPGGVACLVDVDDSWFSCWPDRPEIQQIFSTAHEAQGGSGGDRFVGRKLHGLLIDAGFTDVRAGVHTVTSSEIGMANLLNLATGYKAAFALSKGVPTDAEQLERAVEEVAEDPAAWAALGLFWAVGVVPE